MQYNFLVDNVKLLSVGNEKKTYPLGDGVWGKPEKESHHNINWMSKHDKCARILMNKMSELQCPYFHHLRKEED
jgi:hypothetical protein